MGGVVSGEIEGVGLFFVCGGADFCEGRIGTAEALRVGAAIRPARRGQMPCGICLINF